MADFFDRLIARSVPGADPPELVRVRPRVPGPFERPAPEAAALPLDPEPAPLASSPPPVAGGEPAPRTAMPAARSAFSVLVQPPAAYRAAPSAAPLPAAPVGPLALPAGWPPAAAVDGPRRDPDAPPAAAVPARRPPPGDAPVPRLTPSPSRLAAPAPASAALAAGRAAAPAEVRAVPVPPQVARREQPRLLERTVHVRIGRIEVVNPAPPERPQPGRGRAERRAPMLTLDRYLAGEPAPGREDTR